MTTERDDDYYSFKTGLMEGLKDEVLSKEQLQRLSEVLDKEFENICVTRKKND